MTSDSILQGIWFSRRQMHIRHYKQGGHGDCGCRGCAVARLKHDRARLKASLPQAKPVNSQVAAPVAEILNNWARRSA